MKKIILILFILSPFSYAAAADKWLCVGDKSTGFSNDLDKKQWQMTKFPTSKWIISKSDGPTKGYVAKEFGSKDRSIPCGKFGSNVLEIKNLLICDHEIMTLKFNRKTGRYLHFYKAGFVYSENDTDTPLVEIGTCSKF